MNSVAEIPVKDVLQLQQLLVEKDRLIAEQARRIAEQQSQIAGLLEQFRLQRQQRFGASSEQAPGQGVLFNEAETLVAEPPDEPTPNAATPTADPPHPPRRGRRRPLPPALPRIEVVHDLAAGDQQCACGCQLNALGEEISEQLDIIPAQVRVIRHIRKTYACPRCETAPITAPLPAQPIPKSNASAGLLAHIAVAKYQDGLPLYRQEAILQRAGIDLSRQTLARWMVQAAELLQPLHNLLRDELLSGPVIHCDETVVQVLKEPDKPPQSPSYMWVQAGGPPAHKVILYDYHPSRSGQVPLRLLEGYRGYLMTDGYEGYNALAAGDGITHLCCWAHARRKFVEALYHVHSELNPQHGHGTGGGVNGLDFTADIDATGRLEDHLVGHQHSGIIQHTLHLQSGVERDIRRRAVLIDSVCRCRDHLPVNRERAVGCKVGHQTFDFLFCDYSVSSASAHSLYDRCDQRTARIQALSTLDLHLKSVAKTVLQLLQNCRRIVYRLGTRIKRHFGCIEICHRTFDFQKTVGCNHRGLQLDTSSMDHAAAINHATDFQHITGLQR